MTKAMGAGRLRRLGAVALAGLMFLGGGAPGWTQPAPAAGRMIFDRAVTGTLAAGDLRARDGRFVDVWTIEGRAGEKVTFDLASGAMDASLSVQSPSGESRFNDNSQAGGTNSSIEWQLPEDGAYQVLVTTSRPGQGGNYALSAILGYRRAPIDPDQTGVVHAVIVGISQYQNPRNNLEDTALDANQIAGALRSQGMLAGDSVVLTDEQATPANLRAAFARVAARAGPKDMFLFFYSGHGSQTEPLANSPEADRRDESIVMYDGTLISDDEMARLFSTVHARLAILALDSCFSGGFARDVVSRPGILGIFSSEEEVTSAVAGDFRAGGYLSHFLAQALEGQADGDRDGVIRSGELQTYLFNAFAQSVSHVAAESIEGDQSFQRLVYEPGGVRLRDPVLYVQRAPAQEERVDETPVEKRPARAQPAGRRAR